jgi:hypothetical protein
MLIRVDPHHVCVPEIIFSSETAPKRDICDEFAPAWPLVAQVCRALRMLWGTQTAATTDSSPSPVHNRVIGDSSCSFLSREI